MGRIQYFLIYKNPCGTNKAGGTYLMDSKVIKTVILACGNKLALKVLKNDSFWQLKRNESSFILSLLFYYDS